MRPKCAKAACLRRRSVWARLFPSALTRPKCRRATHRAKASRLAKATRRAKALASGRSAWECARPRQRFRSPAESVSGLASASEPETELEMESELDTELEMESESEMESVMIQVLALV